MKIFAPLSNSKIFKAALNDKKWSTNKNEDILTINYN